MKLEVVDQASSVRPILGAPRYLIAHRGLRPGFIARHSSSMSLATPFPWPGSSGGEKPGISFRAFFEHAPIAVARCNAEGLIVEMNPAFERSLDPAVASRRSLRLCELVRPQDRDKTDRLLRDLLGSRREAMGIEVAGAGHGQESAKWTAWRQGGSAGER